MTSLDDTLALDAPRAAPDRRRLLALTLAAVAAACFPGTMLAATLHALHSLWLISPMIIVGLVLTAGATATGAMALVAGSFRGRVVRAVLLASLVGSLLPVCGITVWPLVAGLLAARVPLAPIMAFWLSSPVTSPSMLAITAATLGLPFAIGKTLAAFGAGVIGGAVTFALTRAGRLPSPARPEGIAAFAGGERCGMAVCWRFWRDASRRATFRRAAAETGRLMLLWLGAAFVAEYFLTAYLPEDWLAAVVGAESTYAVPIAALVGAPIYLDGYAALPLVRGLIDSGMRPDAAMAFLVAGGIVSTWAAIPVYALVRLPVFALYVTLAVACSMLAGWAYGAF